MEKSNFVLYLNVKRVQYSRWINYYDERERIKYRLDCVELKSGFSCRKHHQVKKEKSVELVDSIEAKRSRISQRTFR